MKNRFIAGTICSLSTLTYLQAQEATSETPNIIFIMADDLGWTDLGCYGSTFYETPNIDMLANEGLRFTNAYAACPVSSPTRASFQTGKYPARIGITDYLPGRYANPVNKKEMDQVCPVLPPDLVMNLPLSEKTIGKTFQENGYKTFHIGKWHCAEDSLYFPQYHGYDVNIAGCSKGSPGTGGYFSPYKNPYLKDGPEGEYLTDRLTDECIKLIEKNQKSRFFVNMAYYQVHLPLMAKAEKIRYFEEKAKRLGLDTVQAFNRNPAWKNKIPFKINTSQRLIQNNPVYAAMISSLDENIGRLVNELKRLNLYDHTILLFYSDNGGLSTSNAAPTSDLPLNGGKGFLYEGCVRVPLIVRWKGVIAPNTCTDRYITSVDFYPTLLEMAHIPLNQEQHVDGKSFLPVLKGDQNFDRGPIFWHYPHYHNSGGRPAGAVRLNKYKLIEYYDTGETELFDLGNDLGEKNNLAQREKAICKNLDAILHNWLKEVHALMPIKNPNHE